VISLIEKSISISSSPAVPYQIPVGGALASSSPASASRSNERPIIRSLHRTTSDIFKPLPPPPPAAPPEFALTTPPPPPVNSVAFPGSTDAKKDEEYMNEVERAPLPRVAPPSSATYSASGVEQGRAFGAFGQTYHPYAPYAQDYRPSLQRRGSESSTGSLGIVIGGTGSFAKEFDWGSSGGLGTTFLTEQPTSDSRPRSQSLSSLQYSNSHHRPTDSQRQNNAVYAHSESQNPSTTSLSYYPDATSADGLARSYSLTMLNRPESRASSITSKKYENQLFSR